jgi:predicted MPP superfamily phosphohydrolase
VHYYLWRRLVRDTTVAGRGRRIGTWVVVGLIVVLLAALIGSRAGLPHTVAVVLAWPGYLWLAVMFYLLVGLAILEIPALVVKLRLRKSETPVESRRLFLGRAVAVTAGVAAVGIVGTGVGSALGMPRLKRIQVPLARLPRTADGFRIALVSDIHLGPLNGVGRTRRIVDMINGLDADLVAVVGDLVDGSVAELGAAAAPMADLRSRLGSFFVTGNHEYFSGYQEWIAEVTRLGMRPLRNARVELPDGLDIAGVNDATGGSYGDGPDVGRALTGRDPSRAVIMLAHQPIQAHDAAAHGVDLQLSGHTHGGQMVPFNYIVRATGQPIVSGLGEVDGMPVYVTNGAGFWGPPVRVGAPPDVTLVELRTR